MAVLVSHQICQQAFRLTMAHPMRKAHGRADNTATYWYVPMNHVKHVKFPQLGNARDPRLARQYTIYF
jgi:hypothetical protein